MITLKNQSLTIRIAEMGAELKSIRKAGVEYLWEGRPEVWSGSAPLMFPICGGLRNDTYRYAGKEYTITRMYQVIDCMFAVRPESTLVMTFESADGTLREETIDVSKMTASVIN